MSDVRWETPPEPKRGGRRTVWTALLVPLMERPGTWARIAEYADSVTANSTASNLRRGYVALPAGEWEFVSRKIEGRGVIYARYLDSNGDGS